MDGLKVKLGQYPLTQGARFSASSAQGPISIGWIAQQGALNAIVLYDLDAPGGIFLHYLLVDIPQGQLNRGRVLMPYSAPNPPDKAHRYVLSLLRQNQPYMDIARVTQINFNMQGFLTKQGMQPIAAISFFVQPDKFLENTTSNSISYNNQSQTIRPAIASIPNVIRPTIAGAQSITVPSAVRPGTSVPGSSLPISAIPPISVIPPISHIAHNTHSTHNTHNTHNSLIRPTSAIQSISSRVTPTAPPISPVTPLISPTVPLISPISSRVTPTVPLVTPTVPLVTPTVPLISPISSRVTPTVPLVTPTAPLISPTAPAVLPIVSPGRAAMFIPNTTLTERQQAYCSCVLKVAAKQPGGCNMEKAWFEKRNGETCYNPYAVCAASVKTSTKECGDNYNYENLSDDHLIAFANLHQIREPAPYNRQAMLQKIYDWKSLE